MCERSRLWVLKNIAKKKFECLIDDMVIVKECQPSFNLQADVIHITCIKNWNLLKFPCGLNSFILSLKKMHKWRLILNNGTFYILSLLFMFSDKRFFTSMLGLGCVSIVIQI